MKLHRLRDALLAVCEQVGHYEAPPGVDTPYIVWAEEGQGGSVYADGGMQEQVWVGTVDLFTRTEDDPLFEAVQGALQTAEAAWRLNSVQYEHDTGLIHYEWRWELG